MNDEAKFEASVKQLQSLIKEPVLKETAFLILLNKIDLLGGAPKKEDLIDKLRIADL